MNYEVRGLREGDLPHLADNLRAADVRELVATYGHTRFLDGLERSVSLSEEALVGAPLDTGLPAVMFGIRQFSPRAAAIWACATPALSRYQKPFAKRSREVIERWFRERPDVQFFMNFTHAHNHVHHRWLEWCGAEVLPALPMGPLGEAFRPFTIRRTKYHV